MHWVRLEKYEFSRNGKWKLGWLSSMKNASQKRKVSSQLVEFKWSWKPCINGDLSLFMKGMCYVGVRLIILQICFFFSMSSYTYTCHQSWTQWSHMCSKLICEIFVFQAHLMWNDPFALQSIARFSFPLLALSPLYELGHIMKKNFIWSFVYFSIEDPC